MALWLCGDSFVFRSLDLIYQKIVTFTDRYFLGFWRKS
jgi:hypothetical protein